MPEFDPQSPLAIHLSINRFTTPTNTIKMSSVLIQGAPASEKTTESPQRTGPASSHTARRRRLDFGASISLPSAAVASVFVCILASVEVFSLAPIAGISGRRSLLLARTTATAPSSAAVSSGQHHRILSFSPGSNPAIINWSALFSSSGGQDNDAPDEEEWRAMLAAFQMYNAAYGNLKVPLRFVVPSLAPWPGS